MKPTNIIEAQGSITKNELLTPIDFKILENTFVAEARNPYADYYGEIPQKTASNSLFLFTKQFYPLDDVLKIICEIEEFFGITKKLNAATSILDFTDHYHYAIRIKDFPDHEHIHWLQTCYFSEGINFIRKVHMLKSAKITVFKCFKLEKLEEGIYLDKTNNHKGYIIIQRKMNNDEFSDMLVSLRNNNDCKLFEAAIGTINFKSETKYMIRIISENLNVTLLKCIKEWFTKSLLKIEFQKQKIVRSA